MPKKDWTPEERKAFAEKMKAARKNKENKTSIPSMEPNEDLNSLKKEVEELKALLAQGQRLQPVQPIQYSKTVGTITKYSTDPKDYPDPRDRLFEEERLTLQGFNRHWWDLEWEVKPVHWDSKDGQHFIEPRFHLELNRIIADEETGEPTAKRYTLRKAVFFEDPDAAIVEAHEQGLDVPEELEKSFLDEMRYLRMKNWLLEAFYPPKPTQKKQNKKEEVIGNRLVEVFEVNSVDPEAMFGKLNKF